MPNCIRKKNNSRFVFYTVYLVVSSALLDIRSSGAVHQATQREMTEEETTVDIKLYTGPEKAILDNVYGCYAERVEVTREKYILPATYKQWYKKYKAFEARESDVWVVSYPKSGTTWTQEMVWCLLNDMEAKGSEEFLMKRFPFFEWDGIISEDPLVHLADEDPCKAGVTWKILQTMPDPRPIKSHLHLELLPSNILTSNAKVIYVSRDPRDVCVSYFYHSIKLDGYTGTFQQFLDLFIKDLHFYSPYWKNVIDFWDKRHLPNLLFVRYEEMHEDLPKVIRRVAEFLGQTVTGEYIDKLTNHLSFASMSSNEAVNNERITTAVSEGTDIKFMRKGKVGDWHSHFTRENIDTFKKWTETQLKGTDFPYYQDYE